MNKDEIQNILNELNLHNDTNLILNLLKDKIYYQESILYDLKSPTRINIILNEIMYFNNYQEILDLLHHKISNLIIDLSNKWFHFTRNLYIDYIYLTTEERQQFQQQEYEYLIEQLNM